MQVEQICQLIYIKWVRRFNATHTHGGLQQAHPLERQGRSYELALQLYPVKIKVVPRPWVAHQIQSDEEAGPSQVERGSLPVGAIGILKPCCVAACTYNY